MYLATVSQTVNTPHQGFITPGLSQSPHSTLAIIVSQTVSFPDQGHCTWPQSVKTVNIPHQGHCTVSRNSQHSPLGSLYLEQSVSQHTPLGSLYSQSKQSTLSIRIIVPGTVSQSTHPIGVIVQSVRTVNPLHQGFTVLGLVSQNSQHCPSGLCFIRFVVRKKKSLHCTWPS